MTFDEWRMQSKTPALMIDEKPFGLIACARAAWDAAKADSVDVGWCPRCGSGNDVAGFAHLPGCTVKTKAATLAFVGKMAPRAFPECE